MSMIIKHPCEGCKYASIVFKATMECLHEEYDQNWELNPDKCFYYNQIVLLMV